MRSPRTFFEILTIESPSQDRQRDIVIVQCNWPPPTRLVDTTTSGTWSKGNSVTSKEGGNLKNTGTHTLELTMTDRQSDKVHVPRFSVEPDA